MPNIKSAAKRARQNPKRRQANRFYRARSRNAVRQARMMIEENDPNAPESVRLATIALDKAARKGAMHSNHASRLKSRLAQQLNAAG